MWRIKNNFKGVQNNGRWIGLRNLERVNSSKVVVFDPTQY